jgi:hypothetical protein
MPSNARSSRRRSPSRTATRRSTHQALCKWVHVGSSSSTTTTRRPPTNSRSTPTVHKYIGYGGAQWWALKRDLAWDPRANALLFGQRGPAAPRRISMIQVPVDAGGATWTTAALRTPSILLARIPQSTATQGIRDISYDEQTGDFLILLGRSLSGSDAPFQLCVWNGASKRCQAHRRQIP